MCWNCFHYVLVRFNKDCEVKGLSLKRDITGQNQHAAKEICSNRRRGAGLAQRAPAVMAPLRALPLYTFDQKPLVCTTSISEDAATPWRPNKCIWLGQNHEAAAWRDTNRENFVYIRSKMNPEPWVLQPEASWWGCKQTGMCFALSVPT